MKGGIKNTEEEFYRLFLLTTARRGPVCQSLLKRARDLLLQSWGDDPVLDVVAEKDGKQLGTLPLLRSAFPARRVLEFARL